MPARDSDSLVLRTYPFRDADLVVSFFTRDRGKLRGIARGARRPKSKFGSSLERLAHSRLYYFQKENVELVRLQRADLQGAANLWKADYASSIILDVIAEASDRLLPGHQPHDAYFRLLRLVVDEFRRGIATGISDGPVPRWAHRALVYYLLWGARLGGWLPSIDRCCETDRPFRPGEQAFFGMDRDGLFGAGFKDRNSWPFPPAARDLAAAMLKTRVDKLDDSLWLPDAVFALQRFLLQRTQAQLEGRLRGAEALRSLWRDGDASA